VARRCRQQFTIALTAIVIVGAALLLYKKKSSFVVSADIVAPAPKGTSQPVFIDEQQCAACHAEQFAAWRYSHHALAMQSVSPDSVLGNFESARFVDRSGSTKFSHDNNGNFIVNTPGPDGRNANFPVKYVFGIAPLQQYLLELPRGKFQALSIAWDVKEKHWFHLYPHEKIMARDSLHWTQPAQNWNFTCAECHSTSVNKNYDPHNDSYATTWFQINIGCQACHGPGSAHVQWVMDYRRDRKSAELSKGLQVDLRAIDNRVQIEACARCHSRRAVIAAPYAYGKPLLDHYRPALLDEGTYHADGQIQEEDYEYGSFLQAKMASKGLRCSDCHNPHSAQLKIEGNALCASCHNATNAMLRAGIDGGGLQKKNYDSPVHHFHTPGQPGSHCIECHAPKRNYMVIDARIDHSFRIPRPDLTLKIGTPNACNNCHRDKTPAWALGAINRRYPDFTTDLHYGEALEAGRKEGNGAVALLLDVIGDTRYAAIVRASALRLLQRYPGAFTEQLALVTLRDADPLVRLEAVSNFAMLSESERQYWLPPMLRDTVRAIRIEAARLLASLPVQQIAGLRGALDELEMSYRINFDRPEGRVGLADLLAAEGQSQQAERLYVEVLHLWPDSLEAAVNLADLYRRIQGREAEAEIQLRNALGLRPNHPAAVQALVFSLIRQQRKAEAITLLKQMTRANTNAELAYIYAVALIDDGQSKSALRILESALARAPGDRNLLLTLAAQYRDEGATEQSQRYLKRLAAINPYDPALPRSR
jgi:predicted CXXCH cytochrome family protein